jgi:hypothetical protein
MFFDPQYSLDLIKYNCSRIQKKIFNGKIQFIQVLFSYIASRRSSLVTLSLKRRDLFKRMLI